MQDDRLPIVLDGGGRSQIWDYPNVFVTQISDHSVPIYYYFYYAGTTRLDSNHVDDVQRVGGRLGRTFKPFLL